MAAKSTDVPKYDFDIFDYVFQYLIYSSHLASSGFYNASSIDNNNPVPHFVYIPTSQSLPIVKQPSALARENPLLNSILTRKPTTIKRHNNANIENFVFKKPKPIKK